MRQLYCCVFLMACASLSGQALPNLVSDSAYKKLISASRVKSVAEWYDQKQSRSLNYIYYFDPNGCVSGLETAPGKGIVRRTYINDGLCRPLVQKQYLDKDTSILAMEETIFYNEQGEKIKEQSRSVNPTDVHEKSVSFSPLVVSPGLCKVQIETYQDGQLQTTVIRTDSVAGDITYNIHLQRTHNDKDDEEGALHYTKQVNTARKLGNLLFQESFDMELFGDEIIIHTHHAYYTLYDAKKRVIETGICDYRPALEIYFKEYPQHKIQKTLHPEVMQLIISGKFNPARKTRLVNTYDAAGRKKTVKDHSGLKTFVYDNNGRLTETIITVPDAPTVLKHAYNEKGLLISTVSIDKYNQQEWKQEFVYSYY